MSEKRIKIAFLSVFHPFRGGIAQFNTEVFKALEKKADIRAFNFTTQYPKLLFPGKTQYVAEGDEAPGFKNTGHLSSINPISFQKTVSVLKQYNPDVLITSYWMPFFAPSIGWVCKQMKSSCYNLAICHNIVPHEKRLGDEWLTKFYLNQQHGFAVMSEIVQKDLLKFIPNAKYFLRPHPLYAQFGEPKNVNFKSEHDLKETDKVLLFFGFIRKYKGLDLLLKAMKFLQEDYKLIIAGEVYGDFKEYEEIINEYHLKDRIIRITRYIPDNEVADIFSNSDVCVLPYRTATQSGIASIAKYYELPMVVTPVGELPNEVEPLNTGVVTKDVTPECIAESIQELFADYPQFKLNLNQVKQDQNWDNFASEIMSLINSEV